VLLGVAVTGFLFHLGLGSVNWKLVGLLLIGTVSGAFAGPAVLRRADKKKLERILMPVLVIVNLAMGCLLFFK
jgi:Sulfite exporter TauE/SafE.